MNTLMNALSNQTNNMTKFTCFYSGGPLPLPEGLLDFHWMNQTCKFAYVIILFLNYIASLDIIEK